MEAYSGQTVFRDAEALRVTAEDMECQPGWCFSGNDLNKRTGKGRFFYVSSTIHTAAATPASWVMLRRILSPAVLSASDPVRRKSGVPAGVWRISASFRSKSIPETARQSASQLPEKYVIRFI